MKKILALIALVAFTITVSAQSFVVWPATTNNPTGASVVLGCTDNSTTNLPQSVTKSVPIYLNPDGSFPGSAGVYLAITGTNAGATNVFTVTLRPEYTSTGGTNLSTTQSQTITSMAGGLGTSCVVSNLNSSTFSAASGWRVTSIAVADDVGSYGGYTVRIGGVGRR